MRARSEHADQPRPTWGWLQAWPPASPAGPDESRVQAASLCPLRPCRTGHQGPKCRVQGRGRRTTCISLVVRLCPCCGCIAFTEHHRHSCTTLCPVLLYLFHKKNTIKTKEVSDVLHKWLAFDCLFELCMESHRQVWVVQGLACFLFLFLFFNSESLHLPAVSPSL